MRKHRDRFTEICEIPKDRNDSHIGRKICNDRVTLGCRSGSEPADCPLDCHMLGRLIAQSSTRYRAVAMQVYRARGAVVWIHCRFHVTSGVEASGCHFRIRGANA